MGILESVQDESGFRENRDVKALSKRSASGTGTSPGSSGSSRMISASTSSPRVGDATAPSIANQARWEDVSGLGIGDRHGNGRDGIAHSLKDDNPSERNLPIELEAAPPITLPNLVMLNSPTTEGYSLFLGCKELLKPAEPTGNVGFVDGRDFPSMFQALPLCFLFFRSEKPDQFLDAELAMGPGTALTKSLFR